VVNRPNRMNERAFNEFRYTEFVSNGQTEKPRSSFRFPLRRRQCRREILIGQKDRTQKDTRLIFLRSIFLPLQPPFYTGEKQNHPRPIIASLNTVAVKDKRQISIYVDGTGLRLCCNQHTLPLCPISDKVFLISWRNVGMRFRNFVRTGA
jgi:hypothetical protein